MTTTLSQSVTPSPENVTQPVQSVDPEQFRLFKEQVLTQVTQLNETYASQLSAYQEKLTITEQALTTAQQENEQLKVRVDAVEQRYQQAEIERKLTELNSLTLPHEVKEQYSELIKSGSLGEQEEVVMTMLRQMSASRIEAATTQQGFSSTTQALDNESFVDPYAETIKRNHEQVKSLRGNLTNLLS
jgi:lipoate synthase